MYQTEHDQSTESLQREIGLGSVEILRNVGYNQNPQGRLSDTFAFSRVPRSIPLFSEKKITRRRAFSCDVRTHKK